MSTLQGKTVLITGGTDGIGQHTADLLAEKSFVGLTTYPHAKAAMMAMSYQMATRLQGTGVAVNVVYPSIASISMTTAMTPAMLPLWLRLLWPLFRRMMSNVVNQQLVWTLCEQLSKRRWPTHSLDATPLAMVVDAATVALP